MQRLSLAGLVSAGVLLAGTAFAQSPAAPASSRTFSVPGTATQVRLTPEPGRTGTEVSRDGGQTWHSMPDVQPTLALRFGEFDPVENAPVVPAMLTARASNRLFVVQFRSPIIDEFRVALRGLGAEIHQYLPNQAYLIRADRSALAKITALPFVRYTGEFHPAYRLDPAIINDLVAGNQLEPAKYDIVLVDKHADDEGVEGQIQALGGTIAMPAGGGLLITAQLDAGQLMEMVNDNRVLWIDRWGPPQKDIDNARIQGGANYVESVAGIDGKGITGHIFEGVYASHPEFGARAPYRTTPISFVNGNPDSHGNATAGEIYSQGVQAKAKGILPFAQLVYTNSNAIGTSTSRYQIMSDLVDPNMPYRVMMSTASWGNPRTTTYTSHSAEMDDIIFDLDLFITQSQSNSGSTPSRPQAWAKNICSIGGFDHFDNANPADDCWCNTGSRGPASDGRIGVRLSAYYDSIYTTSGSSGYQSNFGGTSGATPIVNGYGGMAMEMFTDGYFGYPAVSWQNRFDATPHFTTTKCLLIATSRQLPINGGVNWRYGTGWGFPSMQDLYDQRDNMLVLDEEDVLRGDQARTYRVFVKPNTPEFRAVMHYADPAAAPNAGIHRVNSLDLTVVAPDGTHYHGSNTTGTNNMLTSMVTPPGGTVNDRDTEEVVILQNPPQGVYRVAVNASVLRQDGHVETPEVDADFALVVRGIGGGRDRSGMTLDLISNNPGELKVSLNNVPSGAVGGRTYLSFDTSRPVGAGDQFGLQLDEFTRSIVRVPPRAGSMLHFPLPAAPGNFPNTVFNVNETGSLRGKTIDAVTFLYNAQEQIVAVSNVARVTVMP